MSSAPVAVPSRAAMYPATPHTHLQQQQHPHQTLAPSSVQQQPSYPYHHPTPPYYSQAEVYQGYSKGPAPAQQQPQPQPQQQKYLATPSSSFPQPAPAMSCSHIVPQHHSHQLSEQQQQQPQRAAAPLVINTKIVAPAANIPAAPLQPSSSSSSSSRKQQQHSIVQLAEFSAHMVCYLLYGHQTSRKQSHSQCSGTPPSSIPSSPLPNLSSSSPCPCEICSRIPPYSPARSAPISGSSSGYHHHHQPSARPTHRRIMSESDIVQPKPMFRKFCLDVLSATLLSPSVILLSLKYIQQLMINLKESNKIVNTGDGAEYRFFTGALILANKFLDDNTFTNKTWADITGMKIKDVNHLEMQFLNGIDFRLFTSSGHYTEWLANLTQFTGTYMPSQHQVAYQQQAAAAQSPISPMDHATMPVESLGSSGTTRQHGSGSGYNHSSSTQGTGSLSLSMASISHYIDSVKQIQQKTGSSSRYQRAPVSTSYSQQSQAPITSVAYSSQSQYMPSNGPHGTGSYQGPTSSYASSPTAMSYGYQHGAPEPPQRKRSAIVAFDDFIDQAPSYDMGSQSRSTQPTVMVPTHKRSSSSVSTLMSMNAAQEMMSAGPSPLLQHQRHQQRPAFSHRASSGSISASFRGQHQRNASGSYYIDMTGYSSSSSSYGQDISSMPLNTYSRAGTVHPLEKDQDYCYRPASRAEAPYPSAPHSMHHHHGSMSSGRSSQQGYHPSTPPQYSPNKCELSCHSMGCGSNAGARDTYEVDPRLWGPLDSLSLYAITTQAAKRVVAQGKALSASANGLHMYYPTTLA